MEQTKEKRMYMRIRNVCGFLGAILPWLALISAGIASRPSDEWWWSISATYYQSPALVGVLVPASIVLILYIGYDKLDNIITTLSGIFGLGIVLFPTRVSWIDDPTAPVGFFQVPMNISVIVHTVCAFVFFILIAFNSAFLFTKSGGEMTQRKKIRNVIYRVCGYSMIAIMVCFAVAKLLGAPGYWVMIFEILLLTLFGVAWLVKGEAFPFLNDVEEAQDATK